jgi:acetyl esterase/lipase
MAEVLRTLQSIGARPLHTLTPEQARQQPSPADAVQRVMQQRGTQPDAAVRAVQTRDMQVQGAAGMLPARLYTPSGGSGQAAGVMPLIVYWHGGGWVIADLDTYDATPRALAAQTGAVVLSVHYRQAPEHMFPAAHEDAVAAYRWATQNAAQIGADPRRIAVAGESAGGNLAINVAIAAREQQNLPEPVHVLAVYPVAGTDMNTPSYQENAQAVPLSKAGMEWFVRHVFESPQGAQNPRIDLVGRANLQGLPPVTIVSAQIDPLRFEGEALAQKLRQAGVDVQQRTFEGVTHEFFGMAPVVQDATAAQQFAAQRLRTAFGGQTQAATPANAAAIGAGAGALGASGGGPALRRAEALVGTNVIGAGDRDAGEIENLLVDRGGQVRAAVVEWGGFLGIGERRTVVPMEQIQLGAEGERARLNLTREQLEALPRYDRDRVADLGRERGWGEGLRLFRD